MGREADVAETTAAGTTVDEVMAELATLADPTAREVNENGGERASAQGLPDAGELHFSVRAHLDQRDGAPGRPDRRMSRQRLQLILRR